MGLFFSQSEVFLPRLHPFPPTPTSLVPHTKWPEPALWVRKKLETLPESLSIPWETVP